MLLARDVHRVDLAFGALSGLSPLFTEGWGDEEILSLTSAALFSPGPPAHAVIPTWRTLRTLRRSSVREGSFESPSELLPRDTQTARLRWLVAEGGHPQAACLVLAGSREEGFRQRERIYAALTKRGIDVFLLENPYYGTRRPSGQRGGSVRTVSDHIRMNASTVTEARAVLAYLRGCGYERLLVAGYSMGGYMAAITAALTPWPVGVAVMAAGASPTPVFTRGLLSRSIRFARLGGSLARAELARERLGRLWDAANLTRFSPPNKPAAAIIVACQRDGFVPLPEAHTLYAHWRGSELRLIDAGHVSALFTCTAALRAAVCDGLARV